MATVLSPGRASALTVDIAPDFHHQALGDGVDYLEDSSTSLTQAEIKNSTGWQTYHQQELNFGFTTSVYWLRFHITNTSQVTQHLLLENRFPLIDSLEFYFVRQNTPIEQYNVGDGTPASLRKQRHSHFLVPLKLTQSESITVLIRVQSTSGLQVPLALWEQSAFTTSNQELSIWYGVLYGLFLAMALYHLLIYYSTREVAFFHYAMLNFSLLGSYATLHGVASAYFFPDSINISERFINVSMSSGALFGILFIMSILQIPQARPKLARILNSVAYLAIVVMVASLTLSYPWLAQTVLSLTGVTLVLVSAALIMRVKDGYTPAKIIFLGGICASIGIGATILGNLGIVPGTPVTGAAGYLGIVVMSMMDAFALSYRMNMDRQLRQDAQTQLIENQRQTNANLDQLVRERTEELETANTMLRQISNTDALTQLHNRRHFDAAFSTEFKRSFRDKLPLSILLIDVDHFKMINDRYGHPFGDVCLVNAATLIRDSIRRPPDFAARYGGEEFVVLLPNTDLEGALHVATSIHEKFNSNTVEEGDVKVSITVSIGLVSVIPGADDTASDQLKKADMLLYQAKANGRNRIETEIYP